MNYTTDGHDGSSGALGGVQMPYPAESYSDDGTADESDEPSFQRLEAESYPLRHSSWWLFDGMTLIAFRQNSRPLFFSGDRNFWDN